LGKKEIDFKEFTKISEGKLILKLDLNFSKFNQPVKIKAPKQFKTLKEIFEGIREKMEMLKRSKK
jgi:hypothetical protein